MDVPAEFAAFAAASAGNAGPSRRPRKGCHRGNPLAKSGATRLAVRHRGASLFSGVPRPVAGCSAPHEGSGDMAVNQRDEFCHNPGDPSRAGSAKACKNKAAFPAPRVREGIPLNRLARRGNGIPINRSAR